MICHGRERSRRAHPSFIDHQDLTHTRTDIGRLEKCARRTELGLGQAVRMKPEQGSKNGHVLFMATVTSVGCHHRYSYVGY